MTCNISHAGINLLLGRLSGRDFILLGTYRRALVPLREKITSKTKFQCMYKASDCLSNGEMSENLSDGAGFISRKAFEEACRALARCSGSRSSDISLETRREVRSPLPLAISLHLLAFLHLVVFCPMLTGI